MGVGRPLHLVSAMHRLSAAGREINLFNRVLIAARRGVQITKTGGQLGIGLKVCPDDACDVCFKNSFSPNSGMRTSLDAHIVTGRCRGWCLGGLPEGGACQTENGGEAADRRREFRCGKSSIHKFKFSYEPLGNPKKSKARTS